MATPAPVQPVAAASLVALPGLDHAPVLAAPKRTVLAIHARFQHAEGLTAAYAVYRSEGSDGLRQAAFRRSSLGEGWIAEIPSAHAVGATLVYSIEARLPDGTVLALFASREAPHVVQLQDTRADGAEAATLARLDGRRSVVASSFDYVDFGARAAVVELPGSSPSASGAPAPLVKSTDRYVRAEAGYTYRLLRDVAEFGLRIGVVRGSSPGRTSEVGLNYGSPHVRFRAASFVHLEGSLITGITEVGFAFGAGGALLLGDPYGTKLTLGFETVETFGTRAFSRLDVGAPLGFTFSPSIEITDMPHATATGVRLLFEASRPVAPGLTIAARGGYQARDEATGGPTLGLGASYAF